MASNSTRCNTCPFTLRYMNVYYDPSARRNTKKLSSDDKLTLNLNVLLQLVPPERKSVTRMGFDTILLPQVKNAIYGMTPLNISCCRNVTDDAFRHFTNLQSLHTGMPR